MIHQESQTPYSEVEGLSLLLGYKTANAGCCKVGRPGTFVGTDRGLLGQQTPLPDSGC
jgi:hypothetical protein